MIIRNYFIYSFLLISFTLLCKPLRAQQLFLLEVDAGNQQQNMKQIEYKKKFNSQKELDNEINKILWQLFDNAYLLASIDSTAKQGNVVKAYFALGNQYQWAQLSKGNVDEGVLSQVGFREKLYRNKPFYYKEVSKLLERLIRYYENNGYPFAAIKLDSVQISSDKIFAKLMLSKNKKIVIDSIVMNGNAKISEVFLYNYLGIKPGNVYNESQIIKVNTKLAELPFVSSTQSAMVVFTEKQNKLQLFLNKKRASQFDGILGILPDNVTGKILFTGDVRLKVQNALSRGELIDLNWRRLQTQTQDLKVQVVYPFLLKTPFGVDYSFKLYKRDTTFIDVNQSIGIQYLFTGGNYFKVFYTNKTSNLLSTETYKDYNTLPPIADVRNNLYGIGIRWEKLDYRLNPRKGFAVNANISAGTKNIRKNAGLKDTVYTAIKLSSTQYLGDVNASLFISVFQRSTIKLGVQAAFINGASVFQNELYRIGGLKTLRGFDEESIFASTYSIFTLEYRLLLEQNSYLYIFGDQALYEKVNLNNYVNDHPFGFGAGISFETKAGIFSISYALGKQFDNPIQLRSGKVHFGLVNYF
jgi:outer membrane protein assembly factor BamA